MKKNFIIPWEIYPFDVMVCIGECHGDIIKRIEKTGYKLSDEEKEKLWMIGKGRTVMLEGGQIILRVNKSKMDGNFAHEIFHTVSFLMDRIGVKLTYDSEEAFAYAIQFLTNKIIKELNK